MPRYSSLRPLTQNEKIRISVLLCDFFSPIKFNEHRKVLGLAPVVNQILPFALHQFFAWVKKAHDWDLNPMRQRIHELVLRLEQKGILIASGTDGTSPGSSTCYYFMHELSVLQKKGLLWLGVALGVEYIGYCIKTDLVLITGITPKGDPAVGTGTLILPGIILTCAHVIDDMTLDEYVVIEGKQHRVKKNISHSKVDIGIIFLEENIEPQLKDCAFRSAHDLEEVVIAGYPTVPRGIEPVITLNRGEITGHVNTMSNYPLTLFSAIARPGNSGGPVVGLDGRIVGMVTQSLERYREEADPMPPLPFFAAVPAEVIRDSVRELTGVEIPWEDYL